VPLIAVTVILDVNCVEYIVSSGTLNPTILYYTILRRKLEHIADEISLLATE